VYFDHVVLRQNGCVGREAVHGPRRAHLLKEFEAIETNLSIEKLQSHF
jgi:hypothetical protein